MLFVHFLVAVYKYDVCPVPASKCTGCPGEQWVVALQTSLTGFVLVGTGFEKHDDSIH